MKKLAILMVLATLLAVGIVYAAVPGGATVGAITDEGSYLDEANGTVDVNGSQIYTFDLSSDVSTVRWAGITGTLSGSIVLGDDDEATLFEWGGEGLLVYAAENNNIDWLSLADADNTAVEAQYAHITTANAPNDNYDDTFLGGVEDIGSNIFSLTSDHALTEDGTDSDVWKTYSLTDGATIVFAGLARTTGGETNYKGDAAEYQMIIPEDETAADVGVPSTFSLWVELE